MSVVAQIRAEACDAVYAEGSVALRVHAGAAGTMVVVVPLGEWLRATRGERDGNGRPWPVPVVVARGAPAVALIKYTADGVAIPPSGAGRRCGPGAVLPPARLEAYRAARRAFEADGYSQAEASRQYGLTVSAFRTWLRLQRAKERNASVDTEKTGRRAA